MKASVLDLNGNVVKEKQFELGFVQKFRPDLIMRAFLSETSEKYQPKGSHPLAGMQTSAEYVGRRKKWRSMINIGRSRLPKEKLPKGRFGRVLIVPHAVKGRRAHPPKPWKKIVEKINSKERKAALKSAIAYSFDKDSVTKRGHLIPSVFPVIVSNEFESLKKTKDVLSVLKKILGNELKRVSRKGSKGPLLVFSKNSILEKSAKNIPGVDVCPVHDLKISLLAPGGIAGRLVVWTEAAVEEIKNLK